MAEVKKLNEEDYSEARKEAMSEIEKKKVQEKLQEKVQEKTQEKVQEKTQEEKPTLVKPKKDSNSFKKIIETLGDSKLSRKELAEKSGLTMGQIAGCIHRSKKTNNILKFADGKFYVEK